MKNGLKRISEIVRFYYQLHTKLYIWRDETLLLYSAKLLLNCC